MPRATSNGDLVKYANVQFDKMWQLIDSMSRQQEGADLILMEISCEEAHWSRDRNIRDVLVHLYEWHQLLLRWAISNMNSGERTFLPHSYNWKTYGTMNFAFL